MTVQVHIEDSRLLIEEVVVDGGHFDAVRLGGGDDRVYLLLQEDRVRHEDRLPLPCLLEGDPAAEAERNRHRFAPDHDFQVIAWQRHAVNRLVRHDASLLAQSLIDSGPLFRRQHRPGRGRGEVPGATPAGGCVPRPEPGCPHSTHNSRRAKELAPAHAWLFHGSSICPILS